MFDDSEKSFGRMFSGVTAKNPFGIFWQVPYFDDELWLDSHQNLAQIFLNLIHLLAQKFPFSLLRNFRHLAQKLYSSLKCFTSLQLFSSSCPKPFLIIHQPRNDSCRLEHVTTYHFPMYGNPSHNLASAGIPPNFFWRFPRNKSVTNKFMNSART